MVVFLRLILTAEAGKAAIPIAVSVLGTVVLFILARIAMALYSSEDLIVAVKKLQDLNPRHIRLILSMENRRKNPKEFHSICLAKREKDSFEAVAVLIRLPLVRQGGENFVRRDPSGDYYLNARPGSKNEVVLEFELPEKMDEVYLMAFDEKGRRVRTKIDLNSTGTQTLSFHKEK